MRFECHLTFDLQHAEPLEKLAARFHWKTSKIDGDPVLGKRAFFYLTTHNNTYQDIYARMVVVTNHINRFHSNIEILREKIGLIMHDTEVKV